MATPEDPAQPSLFSAPLPASVAGDGSVQAASVDASIHEATAQLADRFGDRLHMGTSSWYFSGWAGLVWGRDYSEATLSRRGLGAYSRHPLLKAVSLDAVSIARSIKRLMRRSPHR